MKATRIGARCLMVTFMEFPLLLLVRKFLGPAPPSVVVKRDENGTEEDTPNGPIPPKPAAHPRCC
jgi:hypothetical protein